MSTTLSISAQQAGVQPITVPPLRVSFSWTFAGNGVYTAAQFGIILVLAKLGSPTLVGEYALAIAISAPVFMLTNLQLRTVQATDACSEHEFRHYFTLRLLASLGGIGIATSVAMISRYSHSTVMIVFLLSIAKAIESVSDVVAGLLQKHERMDQVAIGLMLKGALSITAFTIVFRMFHHLGAAVATLVCSWAAVALCYDLRLALRLEGTVSRFFSADFYKIKQLVVLSAPMGLVAGLMSLIVNVPRFVIEHQIGARELGIFAAMSYVVNAPSLILNALGQSASPRLSRMFARGNLTGFRSLIKRLVLFGACIGVVAIPLGWLFGPMLLARLYTPEYGDHISAFVFLVATFGITSVSTFLSYAITAARCFRMQVLVMISSVMITWVACISLVPRWGLAGASAAIFVASLAHLGGIAMLFAGTLRKVSTATLSQ
jgi:O-antigen/teichoic acid export membrane protein